MVTTIKLLHSVNKSLFLPICINHLNKYLILSCSIYKLVHALMNLDMVIGCIYIPSEPWQKHCIMIFWLRPETELMCVIQSIRQ